MEADLALGFSPAVRPPKRTSCVAWTTDRVVGPAVLRGTGVNFVGACWLRASPLFSLGIAPDRGYCLRAEDRAYPRRNRRGTRQASGRSYPDARRLVAPLGRIDETDRPKDRRTPAYQGRLDANVSDADAFPSTNANWQIPLIEPDAEGPVRGIGLADRRLDAHRTTKKPKETVKRQRSARSHSELSPKICH